MARPIPRPVGLLTALGAISTGVAITVTIPSWIVAGLAAVLIGTMIMLAGVLFARRSEPSDRLQRLVQLARGAQDPAPGKRLQRTDEHGENTHHTIE